MSIRYQIQVRAKTEDIQLAFDQLQVAVSQVPLSYQEAQEVIEFIGAPETLSWLFRLVPTFSASQIVVMAVVRPGYLTFLRAIKAGPAELLALVRARGCIHQKLRHRGRVAE